VRASDHTDHEFSVGPCRSQTCREKNDCACSAYPGVHPDIGLAKALAVLPADVCIIKTGRGYHVLFFSVCEIPESVLPEFGAEVAAHAGRLSVIPPSAHPSGAAYEYLLRAGDALAVVDLEALGPGSSAEAPTAGQEAQQRAVRERAQTSDPRRSRHCRFVCAAHGSGPPAIST